MGEDPPFDWQDIKEELKRPDVAIVLILVTLAVIYLFYKAYS